ncbi:MAG: hypothetical protein HYU66_01725 [Armatimonadetes bacterium]|nr:hypothetical protein [Armatimonadota bacterium]
MKPVNDRQELIEAIVAQLLREVGIDSGVEPALVEELRALATEAANGDPDTATERARAVWEARREEAREAYQRQRPGLLREAARRLEALGVPPSPGCDPSAEHEEPGTLLRQP